MNAAGSAAGGQGTLGELPPFSLDIQPMDLGGEIRAVGLELIETESREPVRGPQAAKIWSTVLPALTAEDDYALDFFSHLQRVREFCKLRNIAFREAAERCMVLSRPTQPQLEEILERFAGETFGMRAGATMPPADSSLELDLSRRGVDAYQPAYSRYSFCAVCEPEDGWVTLLSETLRASAVIERVRPALQEFDVHIARLN